MEDYFLSFFSFFFCSPYLFKINWFFHFCLSSICIRDDTIWGEMKFCPQKKRMMCSSSNEIVNYAREAFFSFVRCQSSTRNCFEVLDKRKRSFKFFFCPKAIKSCKRRNLKCKEWDMQMLSQETKLTFPYTMNDLRARKFFYKVCRNMR